MGVEVKQRKRKIARDRESHSEIIEYNLTCYSHVQYNNLNITLYEYMHRKQKCNIQNMPKLIKKINSHTIVLIFYTFFDGVFWVIHFKNCAGNNRYFITVFTFIFYLIYFDFVIHILCFNYT